MSVIIGAVLLVAAVILFILQPMLSGQRASLHRELDELTEAESRRRVTLLALRDVEYDFATGKLGEEDYQSLKRELAVSRLRAGVLRNGADPPPVPVGQAVLLLVGQRPGRFDVEHRLDPRGRHVRVLSARAG